ncbi:primosomal protein N' [Thermosulfurimonas marina]|uniref:Replication restart protein PriA n=1 Tax=Thermosulfurimonas marina TaxID=2047767 RepID=A0A6H1WQ28_9BACT|nr:primosomal protein N' [Thermosulfurimonas marina]QJA05327.1 primosomal protein N' [Thermosulfurimonas marina]
MRFYNLVLPVPLPGALVYASKAPLLPGVRVLVPVKTRRMVGVVLEEVPEPSGPWEIREVEEVLDQEPLIPQELLRFLLWCQGYYLAPPGEVFRLAFPPGFFREIRRRYRLTPAGRQALAEGRAPEALSWFRKARSLRATRSRFTEAELSEFLARGWLSEEEDLSRLRPPEEPWLEFAGGEPLGEAERFLAERGRWPRRFLEEIFGRKAVEDLLRERRARVVSLPRLRRGPVVESGERPRPSPEQLSLIREIERFLPQGFTVFLLHGVTGSGKTLVYLEVAERVLAQGKSVLVLVPEIALTPYVETHFVAAFGREVAVLHSALSPSARAAEWFRVARGEARVVVGTRLALFAPLRDLGLIVVDEEHDPSYKQAERLPYQARDLALMRGRMAGVPVILGSATPSVKSFYFARTGRYRYLRLKSRPSGRRLPEVELVRLSGPEPFSSRLLEALSETLSRGEQALLFLNRRGYAPAVYCRECGEVLGCPNCSLTLTYHRARGLLLCHFCGHEVRAFPLCPHCQGTAFRLSGSGTERIEEELRKYFPGAEVARLDRDTVTSEKRLTDLLRRLRRGEIQILVGTQMVAQGHDLPGVTLVGVLLAEGGLHLPDYRAAERTFQLLVQVAGRAGRGNLPGRVILQTRLPEHYVLQAALKQDYEAFFEEDLARRRAFSFPPFKRLCLLLVTSVREEKAREGAERAAEFFRSWPELEVLGPAPAPLARLAGRFRWQVLLRAPRASAFDRPLQRFLEEVSRWPSGLRVTLDRDPEELL